MSDRHHYVSQFHLRQFIDSSSAGTPDPWLWVADLQTATIRRRAPKNIGWERGAFSGPGGLKDRSASLEDYLAKEVEAPAARALASLSFPVPAIPPELGRYVAWAAARSIVMRSRYQSWLATVEALPIVDETNTITPAPDRLHSMEHPQYGTDDRVPTSEVERRIGEGWRVLIQGADFLELVHIQAWTFQKQFFPYLRWVMLLAPEQCFFIIGDRPVAWEIDGDTDLRPAYLNHPAVRLFAPLTRSVALFAYHAEGVKPPFVHYEYVNKIIASASHDWIAGPSEATVVSALELRIA
jgi:hypothetical protein